MAVKVFSQDKKKKEWVFTNATTMVVGVVVRLMLFGITSRVLLSGLYLTLSRRVLTVKGDRKHQLNYRPTPAKKCFFVTKNF
jgi:hypothetical protein